MLSWKRKKKERKNKNSKGEQWGPIQLSLLFSPQFHSRNLPAHRTRSSSSWSRVFRDHSSLRPPHAPSNPPANEPRVWQVAGSQNTLAGRLQWSLYTMSLTFSHRDSRIQLKDAHGDKPVLAGMLCPKSNFQNLASPHALLCQTCFSGLTQALNKLAHCRGGRWQNTKEITPVRVLLEVFIPLPPGQRMSPGLTARPRATTSTRPTAALSFQGVIPFLLLCPQK